MTFTEKEAEILKTLIDGVNIKHSGPEAKEAYATIQSILAKIEAMTEKEKVKTA